MNTKETERAEKVANDLLEFVNSYSHDDKAFAEAICRGHRTLQQSVMRLFMTMVHRMADSTNFDERNEASVVLACKIEQATDGYSLPFI